MEGRFGDDCVGWTNLVNLEGPCGQGSIRNDDTKTKRKLWRPVEIRTVVFLGIELVGQCRSVTR